MVQGRGHSALILTTLPPGSPPFLLHMRTQAQRGWAVCSRSHSSLVAEPGFQSTSVRLQPVFLPYWADRAASGVGD